MLKRFSLLALYLAWVLVLDASAEGSSEVAKVQMPQLTTLQCEMLRQQRGDHLRSLDGNVRRTIPLIEPLKADASLIKVN
jgi:hypothetical protein